MRSATKAIAYISSLLLLSPVTVLAQGAPVIGSTPDPLTLRKAVQLVTYAINMVLGLALTIAIAMIVYNGFRMATSGEDSAAFGKARKGLWYAIIGVTVILGTGLIIATIGSFAENPAAIVR